MAFSADGQQIFGGYKKCIRIFHTSRPGRDFVEYPLNYTASCISSSLAQPGVVAIGILIIINLYLVLARKRVILITVDH